MMQFEDKHFIKFTFTKGQVKKHFDNALKDLHIAQIDKILDVKFNYAYSALIKAGITLLSHYHIKVKSMPGHHGKILEKMAILLQDDTVAILGNIMRSKRNVDFHAGGIEVTEKECREYIRLVERVVARVKEVIINQSGL